MLGNKLARIGKIRKEVRDKGQRRIVAAIQDGLRAGKQWQARHTAQTVIREAFATSRGYLMALEEFRYFVRSARALKRRRTVEPKDRIP